VVNRGRLIASTANVHCVSKVHVDLLLLFRDEVAPFGDHIDCLSLLTPYRVLKPFFLSSYLIRLLFEVDDQALNDLHQLILILNLHQLLCFLLLDVFVFLLKSPNISPQQGSLLGQLIVPIDLLAHQVTQTFNVILDLLTVVLGGLGCLVSLDDLFLESLDVSDEGALFLKELGSGLVFYVDGLAALLETLLDELAFA
jgi:hypothetical protein